MEVTTRGWVVRSIECMYTSYLQIPSALEPGGGDSKRVVIAKRLRTV